MAVPDGKKLRVAFDKMNLATQKRGAATYYGLLRAAKASGDPPATRGMFSRLATARRARFRRNAFHFDVNGLDRTTRTARASGWGRGWESPAVSSNELDQ